MQSGEDILGLLIASDELLMEELFKHVQDYLFEKHICWIQQNFIFVLHTVFKLSSCKNLQEYCLGSICADPEPFITSKNFLLLDKNKDYKFNKKSDIYSVG
ncbi:3178_t:CDS:1, partial [Funneliformis mosseae]